MSVKGQISTRFAPAAIGTYSQAIRSGQTVYISGQIPLNPETMLLVEGSVENQVARVFDNLKAVADACDASLNDIVKLTIYVTDLGIFPLVNSTMADYFHEPYPARAVVEVSALPKGAAIEADAILVIPST
jgi:reactive intermediate/imine deaminase